MAHDKGRRTVRNGKRDNGLCSRSEMGVAAALPRTHTERKYRAACELECVGEAFIQ